MKYDFQFLFLLIGIGIFSKKLSWRGWYAVGLLVFAFLMYNWKRA